MELDISGCHVEPYLFKTIGPNCAKLEKLTCQSCSGLDDYALQAIGEIVTRHRKLSTLDFSGCVHFSDEGILALLQTGPRTIKSLNFSNCRSLTSCGMAVRTYINPLIYDCSTIYSQHCSLTIEFSRV